jgi:hypothetical protein
LKAFLSQCVQRGRDFAELDLMSAAFDLRIVPPEKIRKAIFPHLGEITGPIDFVRRIRTEGVSQKKASAVFLRVFVITRT